MYSKILLNRFSQGFRLRTANAFLYVAILEDTERRHDPNPKLLSNILTLVNVELEEVHPLLSKLFRQFVYIRRNRFALRTPCGFAYQRAIAVPSVS